MTIILSSEVNFFYFFYFMSSKLIQSRLHCALSLYLIEMPLKAFANRADPNQAGLVRAAFLGSTLFAIEIWYLILHKWTWQVISLFYVPTRKFIYIIIQSRLSLVWIFM